MSVSISDPIRVNSDVHGATLSDVAGVLAQLDEAAKTEWSPTYTLSGDTPPVAVVSVSIKITMPRWVEYGSATQADKDEWDRFYGALLAHEQGHADLVNQQLSGVDAGLVSGSQADAAQAWTAALQQLQAASDSYDTQTDHGRNQGTIINFPAANPNPD